MMVSAPVDRLRLAVMALEGLRLSVQEDQSFFCECDPIGVTPDQRPRIVAHLTRITRMY